jgi:hypothetical protein
MSHRQHHILGEQIPETLALPDNSIGDMLNRRIGRSFKGFVPIVRGVGSHAINVFKITGTVLVVNQFAIISAITNLTNCTNVYASFWDGTVSNDLTLDGITLSGVPVGTTFFKDKVETVPYTLLDASAGAVYEPTDWKEGKPFYVQQKYGVDSFIRFHLDTTSGVDFVMYLEFEYRLLNGAKLELV